MNRLLLVLICCSLALPVFAQPQKQKSPEYQVVTVTQVIDGDTLVLITGEKIELIGIDCSEAAYNQQARKESEKSAEHINTIVARGRRAAEYVAELVMGKEVQVEFDVQKRNNAGNFLAYVYFSYCSECEVSVTEGFWDMHHYADDATLYKMLNAAIIQDGFGVPKSVPPNVKHTGLFQKLYKEARQQRQGLWQGEKVYREEGTGTIRTCKFTMGQRCGKCYCLQLPEQKDCSSLNFSTVGDLGYYVDKKVHYEGISSMYSKEKPTRKCPWYFKLLKIRLAQ
ncbi:thermonuclease family protein [Candidatus Omnitrophota bacterium]